VLGVEDIERAAKATAGAIARRQDDFSITFSREWLIDP
jgi:hypothetical protein